MQIIGLFPNIKKPGAKTVIEWIASYCVSKGITVQIPEEAAIALGFPELGRRVEDMINDISIAFTVGGDGTLLSVARKVAPKGIPICGINLGQLGFLTEIEVPDMEKLFDKVICGQYSIEERLMLDACLLRDGKSIYVASALNDVVITKGGFSRLVRLRLYIDGEITANYPADGLIISTSTGSTGYSLSAGGPIVNPSLKVIVLTPICPHTLNARPLIISEHEEVKIALQATHNDIVLTIDGQNSFDVLPDDIVVVRSSSCRARFIRLGKSYHRKLQYKLGRGEADVNA